MHINFYGNSVRKTANVISLNTLKKLSFIHLNPITEHERGIFFALIITIFKSK